MRGRAGEKQAVISALFRLAAGRSTNHEVESWTDHAADIAVDNTVDSAKNLSTSRSISPQKFVRAKRWRHMLWCVGAPWEKSCRHADVADTIGARRFTRAMHAALTSRKHTGLQRAQNFLLSRALASPTYTLPNALTSFSLSASKIKESTTGD